MDSGSSSRAQWDRLSWAKWGISSPNSAGREVRELQATQRRIDNGDSNSFIYARHTALTK